MEPRTGRVYRDVVYLSIELLLFLNIFVAQILKKRTTVLKTAYLESNRLKRPKLMLEVSPRLASRERHQS